MANSQFVSVKVTGSKELRKIARKAEDKDAQKALRAGHKSAADIVAKETKRTIPVDSGALRASVKPRGSLSEGKLAIGGARAPYAGRVLYGDPIPGIRKQPVHLDAVADKLGDVRDEIEQLYRDVAKQLASKSKGF